jgi:hypothetical protein
MRVQYVGDWYTIIGAAAMLHTTREAIYKRVKRRGIPVSYAGRTVLIHAVDLRKLEKRHRV